MGKANKQEARAALAAAVLARRLFPRGGFEGLDATELQVLLALWAHGDLSVSELKDLLAVTHSQTSHKVAVLVDAGLVVQQAQPGDARVRRQHITARGTDVVKRFLRQSPSD